MTRIQAFKPEFFWILRLAFARLRMTRKPQIPNKSVFKSRLTSESNLYQYLKVPSKKTVRPRPMT